MNVLKPKTKVSPSSALPAVEYVPPKTEKIEKYAAKVCQKLDEQQKLEKPDAATRQGFTNFIKLAVKIETKHHDPGEHHVRQEK